MVTRDYTIVPTPFFDKNRQKKYSILISTTEMVPYSLIPAQMKNIILFFRPTGMFIHSCIVICGIRISVITALHCCHCSKTTGTKTTKVAVL